MEMELPKPTSGHDRLAFLCGSWVGEEVIHPSQWDRNGGTAVGHVESRLDLGGFFLISDYAQERNGIITHRGHGVYGFDVESAEYTLAWFDATGGGVHFPPARGVFADQSLVLRQTGPFGHSRFTYEDQGPGKYGMLLEVSTDGDAWTPFLEGAYVRRSSD